MAKKSTGLMGFANYVFKSVYMGIYAVGEGGGGHPQMTVLVTF